MKKYIPILLIVLFSSLQVVLAQKDSSIFKIPKQISVEFGYRNSFYTHTYLTNTATPQGLPNMATHGYGGLIDYAWQLSGFGGKRSAAFISVPMGYSVLMPDDATSRKVSMLNYGWTVRHDLAKASCKVVPFLGYGLFLNRLYLDGVQGSVAGHQTQFEGGVNFNTTTRMKCFVKLQCSYSSYSQLTNPKSLHFMYADMRVGVRF